MRRSMKMLVLAATVAAVCAPRQVRAESYLNPWVGAVTGNDSARTGIRTFGVSYGDTGSKLGPELVVGYANKFFKEAPDNSLLDIMAGVTAGPQLGGVSSARAARPYVAAGVGLLRRGSELGANPDFGFNIGAGVLAYLSDHFGVRGEFRYFRTANGSDVGEFHFSRAQVGIVIR